MGKHLHHLGCSAAARQPLKRREHRHLPTGGFHFRVTQKVESGLVRAATSGSGTGQRYGPSGLSPTGEISACVLNICADSSRWKTELGICGLLVSEAHTNTMPPLSQTDYYADDGLGSDRILTIFEAIDGTLWFGHDNGVTAYNPRPGDDELFHARPASVVKASVSCMRIAEGRLWFSIPGRCRALRRGGYKPMQHSLKRD